MLLALLWRGCAATERCVVMVHLNKCGGQTVKTVLFRHVAGPKSRRVAFCTEREYAQDACARPRGYYNTGGPQDWLFVGDSTMALASWLGPYSCAWISVFREPAARLVSALHYCRRSRSDHLCGTSVLDARDASLEAWARHQRGFVFLRLALAHRPPKAAVAASLTRTYDDDDLEWTRQVPTWVRHQRAVLHTRSADDPLLARVAEDLSTGRLIQAVGVLERPLETAAVFDAVLPLGGGLTWRRAFESHHVNARVSAARDADPEVERARRDHNITQHLDYDCHIFAAAEAALVARLGRSLPPLPTACSLERRS